MRRFARVFITMVIVLLGLIGISSSLTEREITDYSDAVLRGASHHQSNTVDHDAMQTLYRNSLPLHCLINRFVTMWSI